MSACRTSRACQHSDSWRCACHQGLRTLHCPCLCHVLTREYHHELVRMLPQLDVDDLTLAELQLIREHARNPRDSANTLRIEKGVLLFHLSDDANPPGMYVYQPWPGETLETLREFARDYREQRLKMLAERIALTSPATA